MADGSADRTQTPARRRTRPIRDEERQIDVAKFKAIWRAIGEPALTSLGGQRGEYVSRTALRTMLGRNQDPAIVTLSQAKGVLSAILARAARLGVAVAAEIDDVVVDPGRAFRPPTIEDPVGSPAAPAPKRSRTIPADVRCIGRDEERRRLATEIMSRERCAILILGEPGLGKSTLASAVANDPGVITRFGARRHAIGLGGATGVEDLEAALSAALGVDPLDAAAKPAAIGARLAEAPTLILLHDLEVPWEACPAAVDAFVRSLAAVEGVAVLASMRGREASPDGPWCLKEHLGPLRKPHARCDASWACRRRKACRGTCTPRVRSSERHWISATRSGDVARSDAIRSFIMRVPPGRGGDDFSDYAL